jgi:TPR repeat protein
MCSVNSISGFLPAVALVFSLSASAPSVMGQSKAELDQLKAAANKGDAKAQYTMGFYYSVGEGVTQRADPRAAFGWYKKAADQGHAEAQFLAGLSYEKGKGVAKADMGEAVRYYTKAAEQGVAQAQLALGVLYYTGQAGSANYSLAAKWLAAAADKGLADAQYRIGICYVLGQGVPQRDNIEAYKWFTLASAQGRKDAAKYREDMPAIYRMSAQQIAEADKRAKDFKPKS